MSRLQLYHEYRKLTTMLFTHTPEERLVSSQDLPELRNVLELRLDGFTTVPPCPKNLLDFKDMSEREKFNAGLMIWIEGSEWQMWIMPFEWRHEILKHDEASDSLFFVSGVPYEHTEWNPYQINPIFGMMGIGPLTGNFMHYLVESKMMCRAVGYAGNTEKFSEIRQDLVDLGSDSKNLNQLDKLHHYLLEHIS